MISNKVKLAAAGTLACVAAFTAAAPAMAQNEHQDLVASLLDAAADLAREQGYSSTHSRYHGDLYEGGEETVTVDLEANTSYMIIAQCDLDCSDIDLWLNDENGNLIDEDVLVDDTPIVEVTPVRSARFTIRTRMVTCDTNPCYFGIAVFGD